MVRRFFAMTGHGLQARVGRLVRLVLLDHRDCREQMVQTVRPDRLVLLDRKVSPVWMVRQENPDLPDQQVRLALLDRKENLA